MRLKKTGSGVIVKAYDLSNINILIIDDSRYMRSLLSTVVRALGIRQVREARDGEAAMNVMQHFTPDIVTCDWGTGPMDGLGFVHHLRNGKDSPNPFMPVIMISAHTEMHRVVKTQEAGINEFLAKPVSATQVYKHLKALIEHPHPYLKTTGDNAYFGPDRRRVRLVKHVGEERREHMPEPVPGDPNGHLWEEILAQPPQPNNHKETPLGA